MRFRYIGLMLVAGWLFSGSAMGETPSPQSEFNFRKAYFYNFYSTYSLASGETWFVGSHGVICAFDPEKESFRVQESGTLGNLYGVSFADVENGWVVGQEGLILHTSDGGLTWGVQESGTKEHLFGVSFQSAREGWAVGAFGTILHTADGGKTWERQGAKVDRIYNQLYFLNEREGWVVGEFGAITHTSDGGRSWEDQQSPLGETTLFSVYFEDVLRGWISGMDGAILRTEDGGVTWVQMDSPMTEHLLSVQVMGDRGWAVGLKGTYAVYDGERWTDVTDRIPTRAWLKDCRFIDPDNGWLVGSVGTLLRSRDGGRTWVPAAQVEGGK